MRFQWQESRCCGGSAQELLLAQRRGLNDADTLIAVLASVYQQHLESQNQNCVKGPSSLRRDSPQWQENIAAELVRPPSSKFPTAYSIWVLVILFALITFLVPLTRRHASSRKCLVSQGPRSRSSASKRFTSQSRPLFLLSWRSSVPPPPLLRLQSPNPGNRTKQHVFFACG